jgi:hypothetical protein
MMRKLTHHAIGLMALLASLPAMADCVAEATIDDVRRAFASGQQREKAGDAEDALSDYLSAQAYTCDPNPVARDAARRAAALGKSLGDAARARGDHAAAFRFYEQGGHFAAADRELLARIQADPDDVSLYAQALEHTQNRALPAFQSNEALRIGITGAYSLDPALARAVADMPLQGAARVLAEEARAFDEAWYAKYLQMLAAQPENPGDVVAAQEYSGRLRALYAGRDTDPLEQPVRVLSQLQQWEFQVVDEDIARKLARQRQERVEARVALLTQKYAGAPKLLELAINYLDYFGDDAGREARAQKVRRQAEGLGDAAMKAGRLQLATEYFGVAQAEAKQEAARERLQAQAMQQAQPGIEDMKRMAEAIRAQTADPAKMAELQRQAQELQRQLEAARQQQAAGSSKGADELAAELGL